MADYELLIDDVARDVRGDSLDVDKQVSGIDTLVVVVRSEDGKPAPEVTQRIILTQDATRDFGGILTAVKRQNLSLGDTDIVYECTAADFNVLPSRVYITATFPAQTVKQRAQQILTDYLSDGPNPVTLDAGQADGVMLAERVCNGLRADDLLTETAQLAGDWVWNVDYFLVLSIYNPVGVSAFYDIAPNDGHAGLISVETMIDEVYANVVTGVFNGAGPQQATGESWVAADGVSAGGFTRFAARYPASHNPQEGYPNELKFDGVEQGGVAFGVEHLISNGGLFAWAWDHESTPAALVYDQAAIGYAYPTGAQVVTAGIDTEYPIRYPYEITVSDAGEIALKGRIEFRFADDSATSYEAAYDIVVATLASRLSPLEQVRYQTPDPGLQPGTIQHIEEPLIDLDADVLITGIQSRSLNTYLMHEVTGVTGAAVRAKYQDLVRQMFRVGGGGTSGGAAATGTDSPSNTLPVYADSGTNYALDFDLTNEFFIRLTGNWTVTTANQLDGRRYYVNIRQDGTGHRTITWPASFKWNNDSAPFHSPLAGAGIAVSFTYSRTLNKFICHWDGQFSL